MEHFGRDIFNNDRYNIILSFDINKSFNHASDKYSWQQVSLIYLKKNIKNNFQIVLDTNYDNKWSSNQINFIYGIKIYKNTFFNIGLVKRFSNLSDEYSGFLTLNFNI